MGGIVVFDDVTEKKENQKRIKEQEVKLVASSKLSSIGEMAGGVAHEVNNPLTVILSEAEYALDEISEGKFNKEDVVKSLTSVRNTTLRISKIIRSLRSISRDVSQDPFERASIDKIYDIAASLCKERIHYREIALQFTDNARDIEIECRPVEIAQVLLNLLINSRDAIEKLKKRWIHIDTQEAENFVKIIVTDSGPGIPQDKIDEIFKPFYTTKEPGKGTGLGLSIVSGIIERHRGSIEVDTKSKNTCFVTTLPKTQSKKEERHDERSKRS